MKTFWNRFKSFTSFLITFIITVACVIFLLMQFALMLWVQDQDLVWEGICSGTKIVENGQELKLVVNCPLQEEFKISDNTTIITFVNDQDSVFYCKQTTGSILEINRWACTPNK